MKMCGSPSGAEVNNFSMPPVFLCHFHACNGLKIPEVKFLKILFFTLSYSACLCNCDVSLKNSCIRSMNAVNKYYLLVMKMTLIAEGQ